MLRLCLPHCLDCSYHYVIVKTMFTSLFRLFIPLCSGYVYPTMFRLCLPHYVQTMFTPLFSDCSYHFVKIMFTPRCLDSSSHFVQTIFTPLCSDYVYLTVFRICSSHHVLTVHTTMLKLFTPLCSVFIPLCSDYVYPNTFRIWSLHHVQTLFTSLCSDGFNFLWPGICDGTSGLHLSQHCV